MAQVGKPTGSKIKLHKNSCAPHHSNAATRRRPRGTARLPAP
jgi:hypothetical protein